MEIKLIIRYTVCCNKNKIYNTLCCNKIKITLYSVICKKDFHILMFASLYEKT